MSGESGEFLHLRQVPNADLVERVPVGGHEFAGGFRKHQITNLRSGVDALGLLERVGAPKADGTVSRAAARR